AEAHTLGVVHRDIKPSNIVVVQRGAERVAKVVDFGVSKMKGLAGTQMQALTADGDLTGSPLYMPPEQLRTKEVDGRADVWSLGASLYELVTGARPFQADNMMVECNRILMEQPRPPSQARAGVPQALDAVVLRCLEKDPARRFATGTELAAALEPFAAKPKSGGAGGRAVVAVAVVALAIAGAAVAWRARPVMSSVVDAPPSADASAPSASASDAP
ncbi:MAG TPA: serine/threonine-protein kinase, partial [Byssovorax sp.]